MYEFLKALAMFGYSEEQFSEFGMTFLLGGFILFMLFIVAELAYKSKAGTWGTLILFFVLSLGSVGFISKFAVVKLVNAFMH